MKALTIKQPWAWLIMMGLKTIETRTWSVPDKIIKEDCLIHAGKGFDDEAYNILKDIVPAFKTAPIDALIPTGALLGVVRILGSKEYLDPDVFHEDDDKHLCYLPHFGAVPYGHIFKVKEVFEHPIPYRGRQKYFNVQDNIGIIGALGNGDM